MTEPEELDEDLFADLYDQEDVPTKPEPSSKVEAPSERVDVPDPIGNGMTVDQPMQSIKEEQNSNDTHSAPQIIIDSGQSGNAGPGWQDGHDLSRNTHQYDDPMGEPDTHGTGIKEDGKMFIGGLNWETTDQSLKDYFSQFGEVQECTVMRDGATGRSRGFGFLTFKDARTVNIVMVKEHYLDGKIIDPKRAIPRDEQERTSKIFVGGVSQDANEQDFKEYFMQYGRVVDATLMMDKDTGRPRGFGFVTFDSEAAVEATLQGDLTILGKPIEVKKAQPRGNMRDEEEGRDRRGGRRGGKDNDRFRDDRNYDNGNNNNNQNTNGNNGNQNQNQNQNAGGNQNGNVMTPQMMAQYWARMQQFIASQMAAVTAAQGGVVANPMANPMAMAMNPLMMQQWKAMQMQAMQQQLSRQQGSQSPNPQSPSVSNVDGMNPAMMQQMQQLQQHQMQQQQLQMQMQAQAGAAFNSPTPIPTGPGMANGAGGGGGGRRGTPGYNAQEQLIFEQQKYEQQQARRQQQEMGQMGYNNVATSWEGMYDEVPPPNMGGGRGGGHHGGFNRQGSQGTGGKAGHRGSQGPSSGPTASPPANAPTGPKNAGVPGANYRGGGRSGHRGGFHPYARK